MVFKSTSLFEHKQVTGWGGTKNHSKKNPYTYKVAKLFLLVKVNNVTSWINTFRIPQLLAFTRSDDQVLNQDLECSLNQEIINTPAFEPTPDDGTTWFFWLVRWVFCLKADSSANRKFLCEGEHDPLCLTLLTR